jgi:uncharacterized damage-inducible protein DinB
MDERTVWEQCLDRQRAALVEKVRGVSEEQARERLVPSRTTLAGLLTHLAAVERSWFQRRLAGRSPEQIGAHAVGDDPSWDVPDDATVEQLCREYERSCAESRATAAEFDLDDTFDHPRHGPLSVRWIYAHMIEETARHAGHADILREQLDARY